MTTSEFPLQGVIGIVANSPDEIQQAARHELQCVEMRPDLLLHKGFSVAEVMAMVGKVSDNGLRCLFTMRRHDHGGKFVGTHQEQMELCLEAVSSGAHIVDVEWDSEYAENIIATGTPTILSHHDFSGMPSAAEIASITNHITKLNPTAIKFIPTANQFEDAVNILKWVSAATGPKRIGFAMGAKGEFSRILARGFGSPITYAAFDAPVAPGQVPINQLLKQYHAQSIDSNTGFIGVIGEPEEIALWLNDVNQRTEFNNGQVVAVPIQEERYELIQSSAAFLRMEKMIVADNTSGFVPANVSPSENQICRLDGQTTYNIG